MKRTMVGAHAAIVAALAITPVAASAHPIDEYVQATYLTIARDRVTIDLDLAAGFEIAPEVVALIDTDRDGRISPAEGDAYARTVLADLGLSVDGRATPIELTGSEWPTVESIMNGQGMIHLFLAARIPDATPGAHRIEYWNGHRPLRSVYLVNTFVPDAPVSISDQSRDWNQRGIRVDYSVGAGGGGGGTLGVAWQFLVQGIRHIFIGPDHILFVIGLLLVPATLGQLLKIVTAFTVAHSITLVLATLGVLNPPARLIEPAIAASIVVVGAYGLARAERRDPRLAFAFGFGLIHGFGFAYALRELILPARDLAWSLFSFNLGVEVGQACIVLLVAPALALLRARASPVMARRVTTVGSLFIVVMGTIWLVERVAFAG